MTKTYLRVESPSNIAWVKYMGKVDARINIPANPSFSMTLDRLRTVVEVECVASGADVRISEDLPSALRGQKVWTPKRDHTRVLAHWSRVYDQAPQLLASYGLELNPQVGVGIRSANTFPADAGIASSASSFSALSIAFAWALSQDKQKFRKVWEEDFNFRKALSQISRQGSGSSCRSFLASFVLWDEDQIETLESRFPKLSHFVLVWEKGPKRVSSSSAHSRVLTSPLWKGRVERAVNRCEKLKSALKQAQWNVLREVAWEELWEMHSLFHTSSRPFSYWHPETLRVLKFFMERGYPSSPEFGSQSPIVTMDAGSAIHLTVLESQARFWRNLIMKEFAPLELFEDRCGAGPRLLGPVREIQEVADVNTI